MSNQIIPVVWEKPLRKSAVNTLDKLNEVIDFINTSDIHEFSFIEGDTGREVVSGTSTQLATLDIFGECVQDGTPTPDSPVPLQVVSGKNLSGYTLNTTVSGITYNCTPEKVHVSGTATQVSAPVVSDIVNAGGGVVLKPGDYTMSISGNSAGIDVQAYDVTNSATIGNASTNRTFTIAQEATIVIRVRVTTTGTQYDEDVYIQLEKGTQATSYTPYGCIGLQIGNEITPIDLQGQVLASLPDGTQDLLRVDSAGVKGIEQYTERVIFTGADDENWSLVQSATRFYFDLRLSKRFRDGTRGNTQNTMCSLCPIGNPDGSQFARAWIYDVNNQTFVRIGGEPFRTVYGISSVSDFKTFLASHNAEFIYALAESEHHDFGVMDMPPIPSDSAIKITASLQPEFYIQWWTESAIPSVINGLKAYVDEQIETVNARIDELHGITRTVISRPDVVIPSIEFEPIEKITVDETETDVEKEI